MKSIKIFIGLLLLSFSASSQVYQPIATWQDFLNKVRVGKSFVPPQDSLSVADNGAIAVKGHKIFVKDLGIWWEVVGLGGSANTNSGSGYTLANGVNNIIKSVRGDGYVWGIDSITHAGELTATFDTSKIHSTFWNNAQYYPRSGNPDNFLTSISIPNIRAGNGAYFTTDSTFKIGTIPTKLMDSAIEFDGNSLYPFKFKNISGGVQFTDNPVFNTTSVVDYVWTAINTGGGGHWAPATTAASVPHNSTFGVNVNSSNSGFFVEAAGIPTPTSTYTFGSTITWDFITTGGHAQSLFTAIHKSVTNGRLTVVYPHVKKVINLMMNPDETVAVHMTAQGATVGFDSADFACYNPTLAGYELRGNGTTTLSIGSVETGLTYSTFNPADGGISFSCAPAGDGLWIDPASTPVTYQGPNQYTIERVYSGLGIYSAKFRIVMPSGGYLNTNPTSADHFIIGPSHVKYRTVNLGTYDSYNGWLITGSSTNFWLRGLFEMWMVAEAISTTSIRVRWQTDYVSATTYKIFRSLSPTMSSPTLVTTSTSGTFDDTGLTTATVYYYEFVPVVGGVDQHINSTFPCPTNF